MELGTYTPGLSELEDAIGCARHEALKNVGMQILQSLENESIPLHHFLLGLASAAAKQGESPDVVHLLEQAADAAEQQRSRLPHQTFTP